MASGRQGDFLSELPTNEVMAAKVRQNGSSLEIDAPARLFRVHAESLFPSYDVSADGQRFLVVSSSLQKHPSPLTVVVNWGQRGENAVMEDFVAPLCGKCTGNASCPARSGAPHAICMERASRGLCSSRREHVKMSVDALGDNLAVVTDAIGAGKERKRRVDQIVKIDQPPIPVQGSMTTPIGRRVTARNVSSVVEACGCQGNLFKGMPTENKIASRGRSGNLAAIVNERIDNRLACDRAQIAHVALGIKKEVIQTCCPSPN